MSLFLLRNHVGKFPPIGSKINFSMASILASERLPILEFELIFRVSRIAVAKLYPIPLIWVNPTIDFLSPGISLPTILTICLYSWLLKYSKIQRNPDKNHTRRQIRWFFKCSFLMIFVLIRNNNIFFISNYLKSASSVQSLPCAFHRLHLQHFLTPRWASISIQKQCIPFPVGSLLHSFCMILWVSFS